MRGPASTLFSLADIQRVLLLWIGQGRRTVVAKLSRTTAYEGDLSTGICVTGHQLYFSELAPPRKTFSGLKLWQSAGKSWSRGGCIHAWSRYSQTWCDRFCAPVKALGYRELNVGVSTESSSKEEDPARDTTPFSANGIGANNGAISVGSEETPGRKEEGSPDSSPECSLKTDNDETATTKATSGSSDEATNRGTIPVGRGAMAGAKDDGSSEGSLTTDSNEKTATEAASVSCDDASNRGTISAGRGERAGAKEDGSSDGAPKDSLTTGSDETAATEAASGSSDDASSAPPKTKKKEKRKKRARYWQRRANSRLLWAHNWRDIDRYLVQNRSLLTPEDVRAMWKRAVYTHIDMKKHRLIDSAPHASTRGRAFLWDLAKETLARKGELKSHQIRDIGWASGKMWFADEELADMVKHDLVVALDKAEVPVPEVVPVVWALAQSGNYPWELFDAVVKIGSNAFKNFNVQNCTNLIWAMAFSGYHPGSAFLTELCDLIVEEIPKSKTAVIPQTVSDMLWSVGRLGHCSPDKITRTSMAWAHEHLDEFAATELLATAQGLAMLGVLCAEDFRKLVGQFGKLQETSPVSHVAMDRMTSLTLLFNRSEREEFQDMMFGKAKDELRREREQWQSKVAHCIRTNSFISSISKVLEEMSIYHQVGTVLGSGQLAVELLLEKEGKMYGVVPVHRMSMNRNGEHVMLGEVKLSQQLLAAQNLPVIGHISMPEWEGCGEDAEAKKRLILGTMNGE